MATALTGAQHSIRAAGYTAVVTELGAGLRELAHHGRALIAGYGEDELPPGAAGQLLAPWPNRVDHGRYRVGETALQLDLSEPGHGNAIHGLARWATWAAVRHGAAEVVLRTRLLGHAGYPFCLDLTAGYRLDADGLRVSLAARNIGSRPAPYGAGSHPYLTAGPSVDECSLSLPGSRWLPVGERGIPDGPPREVAGGELDFRVARPIGSTRLDHALTGLSRDGDGRAWARLAGPGGGVALWAGPGCDWLQVFTGDALSEDRRRKAVAVEPMTCPPNAFVTGDGLIMLAPGAEVTHEWGIQAGQPG